MIGLPIPSISGLTKSPCPQLHHLIEERWQASEIEVLLPEDFELIMANMHDAHDRVLFVWWD